MNSYYPPLGFHFNVQIAGLNGLQDNSFQQVGGLEVEMETENRKEGGENRFEHALPTRTRYPLLSLKRGLVVSSELLDWCAATFAALDNSMMTGDAGTTLIQPKDVLVSLLNEKHEPLCSWNVFHAWPKSWNLSKLNAEENTIAIESIELQYQYFRIKK